MKRIHEELLSTLGADSSVQLHIEIWLTKFKTTDLSCQDVSRAERTLLTIGRQLKVFQEKYIIY
jgi:hypothetical protein